METPNNKEEKQNFEHALFMALKTQSLLFPCTDEQVEEFEKNQGTTKVELPINLRDSDIFIPKKGKVVKLIPQGNTNLNSYRLKVASKKNSKKSTPKSKKK